MEPYLSPTRHLPQLPPEERIGDLERSQVCDQLSAAFATGQLDQVELEDRLARAVAARTRREVLLLTSDLGAARPTRSTAAQLETAGTSRQAWSGTDVLAVILLAGSALSIAVIMFGVAMVSPLYFFFAVLGGSLAFVAGVSTTQLVNRSIRRTREAIRAGG